MSPEKRYWIDHVSEKHECFDYTPRAESIEVDGETLVLLVPDWVSDFEVVEATKCAASLYLLLRDREMSELDGHEGIIVMATQQEDGSYAAVIWHHTYPYVWDHLSISKAK